MVSVPSPYAEVFDFHGHRCSTVIAGALMAQLAMEHLQVTKKDHMDLFARVEFDWCGVDGIQYITGCTSGNRNLKVHPRNIWRMQLVHKPTGNAVEVDLAEEHEQALNNLLLLKTRIVQEKPHLPPSVYKTRMSEFIDKDQETALAFIKKGYQKSGITKKITLDWKNTR